MFYRVIKNNFCKFIEMFFIFVKLLNYNNFRNHIDNDIK